MKRIVTILAGAVLVVGGFAGGIIYNNNKIEYQTENKLEEYKDNNYPNVINYKNTDDNNNDYSKDRYKELNNIVSEEANKLAVKNPDCTKDDAYKAIADKLKSIGVSKEEAEMYDIDKDIINYLN